MIVFDPCKFIFDVARDYINANHKTQLRLQLEAQRSEAKKASAEKKFKQQKRLEENKQEFQLKLLKQNQSFQNKMQRERESFAVQMQESSQDFQREMAKDCQEFQVYMEENKQQFELRLEENKQQFQQHINDENAQLQRELNEQNHIFRLEEIKANFELACKTRAYQQIEAQWPLCTPPVVLRDEQILADSTMVLRVLFSRSIDDELQKSFYPIIEQNLVEFVDIYRNYFYSDNIIFYQNAWKDNCYGSAYKRNIYSILKEFPTLIVDANILPDNTAKISASIWGFGSEREFSRKVFDCDCDKTKICSNISYRRSVASQISAYLKFVIGYMYDLYNLVLYNRVPLLPKVASVEKDNSVSSALLNYDDIKKEISNTYSGIYSQILSIAGSNQSAEIKVLTGMNNTQLHQTRFDYVEAVKDYVSTEQYLQCLDESIRAWVDLRTDKSAEEFLQDLAGNGDEVEKYFSGNDIQYFDNLCNVYSTTKDLSKLGYLCLQIGVYINIKVAVKYCFREAEQNKAEAQYLIGEYYRINNNYGEALGWYTKAASQGCTKAKDILCTIDKRRKAKEKFETLCKDADQGDIESQFELAEHYYTGNDKINVEQNYLEAMKWYRRAAEYGHGFSLYRLGYCYQFGYGLDKNLDKAMQCYRKALDNGYKQAKESLNKLEEYNKARENRERLEVLQKDAKCGDMEAQYALGEHYFMSKNYDEAKKWYKQASELGYDKAKVALERLERYKQAVKQFEKIRKEAENGDIEAQYQLAEYYYNGYSDADIRYDYVEAVKWYLRAAEHDNISSQYKLGNCYKLGNGVSKNCDEAARWYRIAADRGNSDAQYELANCYLQGIGVKQDYNEAFMLYRKSAESGNSDGQRGLGDCYYFGYGVDIERSEAAKWYKKSAGQLNISGMWGLGRTLVSGIFSKQK